MSLNIKNERVHELVREAARRTGQSQTSVIETALQRYLERLDLERRRERADDLVADLQKRTAAAGGVRMRPDDLYDERGLPA